jgi:hypothetical protein
MPNKRLSMRQIKELLRLCFEVGLKIRPIARSLQISPATVGDYLRRAKVAGLSWPLPVELDEAALEWLLFPPPKPSAYPRPLPDWAQVHQELKRKGVTLALLWHEYKSTHPEGLQYSQFCERYRRFAGTLDLVMRQSHQGRREALRRLRGANPPHHRPHQRGDPSGPNLRRGAGREFLHLCRGEPLLKPSRTGLGPTSVP